MNKRLLVVLAMILIAFAAISTSSLIYVIPIVPIGFALAATQDNFHLRALMISTFTLGLVAIGESPQFVVTMTLIALVISLFFEKSSHYTRVTVTGLSLVVLEYLLQLPGLSSPILIAMVLRVFLVTLITVSFINIYALQKT